MQDRWNAAIAKGLFAGAVLCQVAFVAFFWSRTWDDAAITMAFARTFSRSGVIEATPGSGIVEGYSTTLWMLTLAALARVAASPAALLAAAKVLACLLNVLNLFLVRSFARRSQGDAIANLTAAAFGLMELTFCESINAMEGPLALALMLTSVLCLPLRRRRDWAIFLLASCLFILVRFEAVVLMLPLLLFLGTRKNRVLIGTAWLGTLLVGEWARWSYFGSWVPNTILAKRHPPYSSATLRDETLRHLDPAATLPRLLAMLLVVLIVAAALDWKQLRDRLVSLRLSVRALHEYWKNARDRRKAARPLEIAFALAATGVLLDFGIGRNWGPPDRELFPVLPFIVFVLLSAAFALAHARNHRRILCLLLAVLLSYRTMRIGQRLQDPLAPWYMPGITVNAVASLVPPVERIRNAASLPSLTLAVPDIGGVILFAPDLRLLDLGMLCDRRFGRDGYAQAPEYIFGERKPEIIETHQFWTLVSRLGESQQLVDGYVPIYIGARRFFVRLDLFQKIEPQTTKRSFLATGHPQAEDDIRPEDAAPYPIYDARDFRLNSKFGSYYVFSR